MAASGAAADGPAVACKASTPICELGGAGMFLPLSDAEADMDSAARAVIYGLLMVYLFMGVAIIADTFMASIDKITSRWKQSRRGSKVRTSKVWNETVATLTLMALGSSAPEIFLAVIDVVKKEFHAAHLGPSTIVGSASFNLLVIVAVCIASIPSDQTRVIKELPAFYITAFFSLLAYLWVAFILVAHTKDQVDPWEAIATFLFLPVLVWVSYKTNVGAFDCMLTAIKPEKAAKQNLAVVGFQEDSMVVKLTAEDQKVRIPVVVSGRRSKPVYVKYASHRFTSVPCVEYKTIEGKIVFDDNTADEQAIELTVMKWSGHKQRSRLLVVLEEAEGADFDPEKDGGDQCAILTVILESAAPTSGWRQLCGAIVDIDGLCLGLSDWREQCVDSLYVGGSRDYQADASLGDFALHAAVLPWKLLFAAVPPPSFFGGWLCFAGSLGGIGLLTAFVSDLAELFGCVLELGDVVTAITFVALGTSMPDLFASLSAAREDETADASVVNVTGSNSVNVFLGLGLPWTICAIYWAFKERTAEWAACYPAAAAALDAAGQGSSSVFVVESGHIGFSVLTFCCCCIAALLVIFARRMFLKAELGGPLVPKAASASVLVALWLSWIFIVVWKVKRYADSSSLELGLVTAGFISVVVCGTASAVACIYLYRRSRADAEARDTGWEKDGSSAGYKTSALPALPSEKVQVSVVQEIDTD